jgi:hypothetical protein
MAKNKIKSEISRGGVKIYKINKKEKSLQIAIDILWKWD